MEWVEGAKGVAILKKIIPSCRLVVSKHKINGNWKICGKYNKTGLQPVSRPILGFYPKGFKCTCKLANVCGWLKYF